jgi:hypothetical protein
MMIPFSLTEPSMIGELFVHQTFRQDDPRVAVAQRIVVIISWLWR